MRQALLHCVVGEVDAPAHSLCCEFLGGGANVALLVPVKEQSVADLDSQHETADVKLAPLVQHGVDVFLQHPALLDSEGRVGCHERHCFLGVLEHADAPSPVAELPRLQNPQLVVLYQSAGEFLPVVAGEVVVPGQLLKRVHPLLEVVVLHVSVQHLFVCYLLAV